MWDPQSYLAFSDYRDRPTVDLLARVGAGTARRAVDLGCGAGNLTPLLTRRWPQAVVEATDASPEMVAAARAAGVDARLEDVRRWQPRPDTDVVMCNAVLQWVPGHVELLHEWVRALPPGGWFAFHVPGNFESPSYRAIRDLVAEPEWRLDAAGLLRSDSVLSPTGYADALADAGMDVDAWETTYVHPLRGDDPVLEWVSGTALRPVRATLDERQWHRFRSELGVRLRSRYPQREDGVTWFPMRRVFVVAHRP